MALPEPAGEDQPIHGLALHKALILTLPGMTDTCAAETKELIGVSCTENANSVALEASLEDIFTICYRSQTASRVILVLSEKPQLKIPEKYLQGTISIEGTSTLQAQEFLDTIQAKKTYKNADTPLYLHTENEHSWLGIDLTGDISKRDYRIFIGSETLIGITCYGLLKLVGYEPKHTLLDPNCRAGSVVIEAALHALQLSPRYYSKEKLTKQFKELDTDKLFQEHDKKIKENNPGTITALSEQFPSVQATRKNAKVAGVVKAIDFSRTSVDWLDLKFAPNSIDRIITQPIEFSKNFPPAKFKKLAELFFERAKTILKKNGKIGLIMRHGHEEYTTAAKQFSFTPEHQRTIKQGKEEWNVLVFKSS